MTVHIQTQPAMPDLSSGPLCRWISAEFEYVVIQYNSVRLPPALFFRLSNQSQGSVRVAG